MDVAEVHWKIKKDGSYYLDFHTNLLCRSEKIHFLFLIFPSEGIYSSIEKDVFLFLHRNKDKTIEPNCAFYESPFPSFVILLI